MITGLCLFLLGFAFGWTTWGFICVNRKVKTDAGQLNDRHLRGMLGRPRSGFRFLKGDRRRG